MEAAENGKGEAPMRDLRLESAAFDTATGEADLTLRFVGLTFRHLGSWLVNLYDMIICVPVFLANQMKSHSGGLRKPARGQP